MQFPLHASQRRFQFERLRVEFVGFLGHVAENSSFGVTVKKSNRKERKVFFLQFSLEIDSGKIQREIKP